MQWHDLAEMIGWTLGCSRALVLLGWFAIWRARTRSLTLSMVVLVLIPTLATITGVLGASPFHDHPDVLADNGSDDHYLGGNHPRGDACPLAGSTNCVGEANSRNRTRCRAIAAPASGLRQPFPCRAWTGMAAVGAPANNVYRATCACLHPDAHGGGAARQESTAICRNVSPSHWAASGYHSII